MIIFRNVPNGTFCSGAARWAASLVALVASVAGCQSPTTPEPRSVVPETVPATSPRPQQTKEEKARNIGMLLTQFFMNCESCSTDLDLLDNDIADKRYWVALSNASDAVRAMYFAELTLPAIRRLSPEWQEAFSDSIEKVNQTERELLPQLRGRLAKVPKLRREYFLKLTEEELSHIYSMPGNGSLTLPYEGDEVDVKAEMAQRRKASTVLLECITTPEKFIRAPELRDNEDFRMCRQITWAAAYELLVSEAEWLLTQAPEADRAECARMVVEIKKGLPAAQQVLKEAVTKVRPGEKTMTFADAVERDRDKVKSWQTFPKSIKVVSSPAKVPGQ